ncbi:MAG: hypothetical protein D6683_03900, partial [Actinomyces sp.]
DWPRAARDEPAPRIGVEPAVVSGIEMHEQSLSFDVDRVGTPVLVKVSYFPNWRAEGAEGPWRITPNLMVVVPTAGHVELTYGRSGIELVAMALTLAGLVGVVVVARRRPDDDRPDTGTWWDLTRAGRSMPVDEGESGGDAADTPADEGEQSGATVTDGRGPQAGPGDEGAWTGAT